MSWPTKSCSQSLPRAPFKPRPAEEQRGWAGPDCEGCLAQAVEVCFRGNNKPLSQGEESSQATYQHSVLSALETFGGKLTPTATDGPNGKAPWLIGRVKIHLDSLWVIKNPIFLFPNIPFACVSSRYFLDLKQLFIKSKELFCFLSLFTDLCNQCH